MAKRNRKSAQIGKTKKATDALIDKSIAQQNSWLEKRRAFARRFLKKLNVFAKPAPKKTVGTPAVKKAAVKTTERKHGWTAYWFPIVCALLVIFIAIWVAFVRVGSTPATSSDNPSIVAEVPEPITTEVVEQVTTPTFDIVRIEKDGNIVVAGRGVPNSNISVLINSQVVATAQASQRGEFAYAPTKALKPGNYTISLIDADKNIPSENKVFVYISQHGFENSISLLMTKDGSTLLQSPKLVDGDLAVSKIDYLDTGRIVITGDALPRLRVSMTLNNKYLGFARVSSHKHFGLGADVEKLEPGTEYKLAVRLHDGDGKTVSEVTHTFKMPTPTGNDDTFYTVRRGDCLWIIARNFMRRGVLFSIIAEKNNIENPDLIFPKQVLQIPVDGK